MTDEPSQNDGNIAELSAHRDRAKQKLADSDHLSRARNDRTLEGVNDTPTRPEIDAKLAAAEARTETRFVQLDAKIDRLADALTGKGGVLDRIDVLSSDNKDTRRTVLVTTLGALLAVVAIVVAMVQLDVAHQANLLSAFQAAIAVKPH